MRNLRLSSAALGVVLLVAGCGSTVSGAAQTESTTVRLAHLPTGTAVVTYDAGAQAMTVALRMTGLTPNSSHMWGLGKGSCAGLKGPLFQPQTQPALSADDHGVAETTFTFKNMSAIPTTAIHVHIGPGHDASDGKAYVISCADLLGVAGTLRMGAYTGLAPPIGDDVSGTATLRLDKGARTLTVKVRVDGLEPGSSHPNHIHNGSCELQGPVAYGLTTLTADQSGHAEATTTVKDIGSIAYGAWYINVHRGPGLDSPEQFTPLTCGDVSR